MIRKASKRGYRGLGVTLSPGFADIVGMKKGTHIVAWVKDDSLYYSTRLPDGVVFEESYTVGRQGASYIITLLPEWVKANKVEATMPLNVSIKDNCIVVQKA